MSLESDFSQKQKELQQFVDSLPDYSFLLAEAFISMWFTILLWVVCRYFNCVLYLISEMSGKDDFLKTDLFKDIRKLINIIDEVRDYGLDK